MKSLFILILGWALASIGTIWSLVSFIMYLVKDTSFAWIALVIMLAGYSIILITYLIIIIKMIQQ